MLPSLALIKKYDQPVPRYTSYPTVPFWRNNLDLKAYAQLWQDQFTFHNQKSGISLYLHLPFCESLCTYCGCNKKITTNHKVEEDYILALEKEWQLYLKLMNNKPIIRELHLGGGTPTFFTAENLRRIIEMIFKDAIIHENHDFSFEGHPNNTTNEQLQTLFDLGFTRVSYGVQDNDPIVQKIINRIQPFANVQRVTEQARSIGYNSVNFDLIYGLPKQTLESIKNTFDEVLTLKPDRIAFYSYAHVPWTSKGQRLFDENDLPNATEKLQLYQLGKSMLLEAGYTDIGMDHFALDTDSLLKAQQQGALHRNFMGYTTQNSSFLLGLGVSSISDIGNAFGQNHKTVREYYEAVDQGIMPIFRGYLLSEEDLHFKYYILDAACRGKVDFKPDFQKELEAYTFPELRKLEMDGLIEFDRHQMRMTELGRNFTRNICRAFDIKLLRDNNEQVSNAIFSKAL